ncbi:MAG: hypothetical protein ACTSXW_04410 [Candidatus Baldrarchaeia archaeon]
MSDLEKNEIFKNEMVAPFITEHANIDPSTFIGEYGGYMDKLAVVAKAESGEVLYQSSIAPPLIDKENFVEHVSNIASYLDIKVYIAMHAFLDKLFHKKFKVIGLDSEKPPTPDVDFICPNRKGYWKYLAEIMVEVVKLQISGIFLLDFRYPWRNYCFCTECIKDFRTREDLPVYFHYGLLEEKSETYDKWLEWRSEILYDALKSLTDRMNSLGTEVPVILEIIVDPISQMLEGVFKYFGQDLRKLSNLANGFILNIYPYSMLSKDDINEEVFEPILAINKPIYMLYTKKPSISDFEILKNIAKIVDAKKIFLDISQIIS